MKKQLIVLLSRQRSGTNALRAVLSSHQAIHCFGEVLSCADAGLKQPFSYFSFAEKNYSPEELASDNQLDIFEAFVERLHGQHDKQMTLIDLKYNSCHHISKLWKNLCEVPLFTWILRNQIPVIRLRRDNYLRVSLSEARAQARQKWHDFNPGERPATRIMLPNPKGEMRELLRRLRVWRLDDQIADHIFERSSNILELQYTELFPELNRPISALALAQISKFLNVKNEFTTETKFLKTEQKPLSESVANWLDVRTALEGTEFEHCLADEPMYHHSSMPSRKSA